MADPGIRQWGGRLYWRGGIFWSALLPPPPPPLSGAAEGIYDWGGGGGGGGLPKARIIKFMNFNGGICSPYSFRQPGGGGGGKKLHRAVFYGDRSKLFWMSLYKLITVYTRAISE